MSAKFDKIHSLPFKDISIEEKPKCHGRTDRKTDNLETVYNQQIQFVERIINALIYN